MLIGEIVRKTGLSKDTIRSYEAIGLLHSSPRQAGSRIYRDYDDQTYERLAIIAMAMPLSAREPDGGIIPDPSMRGCFRVPEPCEGAFWGAGLRR